MRPPVEVKTYRAKCSAYIPSADGRRNFDEGEIVKFLEDKKDIVEFILRGQKVSLGKEIFNDWFEENIDEFTD